MTHVSTTKGARGETTYSNGRYNVTIAADGAVHVRQGDWLSKYSAAMYNDFAHINEFGRLDPSGAMKPIRNVNLIIAGETIYHVPTYRKAHPLRMEPIELFASPLSDEEQKKVIVETLKNDYDLAGERLHWLEVATHIVHGVDSALTIAEIAGLIAEETALATAGTVVGLASMALMPVMMGIPVLNANETDKKIAGMQAIGYTVAAWAFGDPIPRLPASLRANIMSFPGKHALPRYEEAWNAASQATVRNLEAEVVKRRKHKQSYQIYWQALGSGDRRRLVRLLMEGRAKELRGVEKDAFWGLNPDKYPN